MRRTSNNQTHLERERLDELGLKDEDDGDPLEEAQQGLERGREQRHVGRVLQDVVAQREDQPELLVQVLLHRLHLLVRHAAGSEVEHLLAARTQ